MGLANRLGLEALEALVSKGWLTAEACEALGVWFRQLAAADLEVNAPTNDIERAQAMRGLRRVCN